jgi:hypothetical protein
MWSQGTTARFARIFSALSQAASIASFAWVALPVLAPLAAVAAGFALGHPMLGAFAGGAIAMLVLATLVLAFPLRAMIRQLFFGFRHRSVEVTLRIDENGPRQHQRDLALDTRIVRTGIRKIPDQYCAPGPAAKTDLEPALRALDQALDTDPRIAISSVPASGPTHAPRVVQGDARVLGPLYDPPNDFWIYDLDLGASLSAGTDRQIRLQQDLDFRMVEYAPRLQRTILDPTDRLLLALKLPNHLWPVEAEGEEFLNPSRPRKLPVQTDERMREVRLVVDRPRYGHIYRLRWSPARPGPPQWNHDESAVLLPQ